MMRAYFRAANFDSISLFAPVQTILPELNINAVVLGALILIIRAANLFGLYSALRACRAIFFKSNLHPTLIVLTIFLKKIIHLLIIILENQFFFKKLTVSLAKD
jgi:hypothetical protein